MVQLNAVQPPIETLDEWMEGFITRPKPPSRFDSYRAKPGERFARDPNTKAAPAIADALVLFVDTRTCACGHVVEVSTYLGVRRRIKGGHAYLAYQSPMAPMIQGLPRLLHHTTSETPWCLSCFQPEGTDTTIPQALYGSSRVCPDDDLSRFVKNAAAARAEESTDE